MAADPIDVEAADLLACLASQPSPSFMTSNAPGMWRAESRVRAARYWSAASAASAVCEADWRELYAEAEARLREVIRGR